MLLRVLALIGLTAPHVVYVAWLVTAFDSFNAAANNSLAKGFFFEMAAATALMTLFFKANPIGKANIGWFVLFSVVGGAGMAIPAFYWINKNSSKATKKLRAKSETAKETLNTVTESIKTSRSLILNGHSA
jgi:hypothetical protein